LNRPVPEVFNRLSDRVDMVGLRNGPCRFREVCGLQRIGQRRNNSVGKVRGRFSHSHSYAVLKAGTIDPKGRADQRSPAGRCVDDFVLHPRTETDRIHNN